MNPLERISGAIRHAPGLERANWLWKRLRPIYDRILSASFASRGLERIINGTDRIVLSTLSRHFVSETYEPEVWGVIMNHSRIGDTVADVGASIGIYTLAIAARVGASGRVVAFEPDPASAAELEANIAVNRWQGRISVMRAVAGDNSGEVSFACARGVESHVVSIADASAAAVRLPMVTLDSVFPDSRVDLLKIDTEGYEEPVLRGAQALLADPARRPRAIIVEVHPFAWQAVGSTSASLLESLTRNGYRVASLAGEPVTRISDYGHIIATAN
ncbi:MAG TPA: FkbM family methyltransferase [Candidatus Binataceae bacterium]|nr:FkbM family methyltransferase [Candidatus Binataceae bacterium]